jgi:hypothetical protein
VLTLFTSLIINNLNAYKTPYTFLKVFTSLGINNLNAYTNVKVRVIEGNEVNEGHLPARTDPYGGVKILIWVEESAEVVF